MRQFKLIAVLSAILLTFSASAQDESAATNLQAVSRTVLMAVLQILCKPLFSRNPKNFQQKSKTC